ncbi:MAG: MucR family transcriptional regulator [Rhizobiaceae bacterium]
MDDRLLEFTVEIVTAYVSNNSVQTSGLQGLVTDVSSALAKLSGPVEPQNVAGRPAVDPKRSIHADHLICLEDGLKFKTLRRHLMVHHGMTPDQYRAKWGLKAEYPMTAPAYSKHRTVLAKRIGLGNKLDRRRRRVTRTGNKDR